MSLDLPLILEEAGWEATARLIRSGEPVEIVLGHMRYCALAHEEEMRPGIEILEAWLAGKAAAA